MHGHLNVLWGAAGMLCSATLYAPPPSTNCVDMHDRHVSQTPHLTVKCLLCNIMGLSLKATHFCCLYGVILPLSATMSSVNIIINLF